MWEIDRREGTSRAAIGPRSALAALLICVLPACSGEEGESVSPVDPVVLRFSDAEAKSFFNQHACNACHEVDEFRIGPAYRDISLRYSGEPESRTQWLAEKIVHGGAGNWGLVPMISNPDVTPEEARAVASWIMALGDGSEPNPATSPE